MRWNNPRLHDAARRKTWLACDAHRETLQAFLSLRGFLRDTIPLGAGDAPAPTPPDVEAPGGVRPSG